MIVDVLPEEYELTFVRSAGPGGQNVNKLATAAQLRFFPRRSNRLNQAAYERLVKLAGRRMTDAGEILIIARTHRSQEGNRREALGRLTAMLEAAMTPPVPRRATKPTRASKVKRLEGKQHAGRTKKLRRSVRGDD